MHLADVLHLLKPLFSKFLVTDSAVMTVVRHDFFAAFLKAFGAERRHARFSNHRSSHAYCVQGRASCIGATYCHS